MAKRILVIDDEADIRDLIAQVLKSAGYEVLHATNGQQGLEMMETAPVDLVILDIIMQGMDGWDVCEHIKTDARFRHIPVLLVTVRTLITEQEERRNRIADAVLLKPFSLKDLQQQVSCLVSVEAGQL
ncbi:MAG: response regulator [Armatimonadota bacterium]